MFFLILPIYSMIFFSCDEYFLNLNEFYCLLVYLHCKNYIINGINDRSSCTFIMFYTAEFQCIFKFIYIFFFIWIPKFQVFFIFYPISILLNFISLLFTLFQYVILKCIFFIQVFIKFIIIFRFDFYVSFNNVVMCILSIPYFQVYSSTIKSLCILFT